MRRAVYSLVTLLPVSLLSGCGQSAMDEGPAAETTAESRPLSPSDGKAAYEQYCAGCHETGMMGAPVVGNAADWAGVSTLWQAVVMEHARAGYFDMPAKGSRPDLPDATIDAATEHMLEITFPDLPADVR